MIELVASRAAELWLRTGEHLMLTGVSTVFAIAAGLPLGILAARVRSVRGPLLGVVGIMQTVPSLAMLAFLLALLNKIGAVPAIIALTLYALLPIVRNTLAGLEGIAPEVREAADGIGMTARQRLLMVEIPMATPVIIAGIRTAAVIGVGIATLAAFIGAGGLGQFIVRGLALANTDLILLGAIPAALLALVVDNTLGAAEWGLQPRRKTERGTAKARLKPAALSLPVLLVVVGVVAYLTRPQPGAAAERADGAADARVSVATKNFTEQFILGELMAQLIADRLGLGVDRRFNLGGTMITHGALARGEVDLYAEYTGTALTTILDREVITDPERALEVVRDAYRERFELEWLRPFGFDNTYALAVRQADARENGWRRISDLSVRARELSAGFTSEFVERPDGYPALVERYGFQFGQVRDMDAAIMYEALARGAVDVISAFATDGRIEAYDLVLLEDDRRVFPPYEAAPVARLDILRAHPRLRPTLELLAGRLNDSTMRSLNYEVDENERAPAEVAREFLEIEGLLGGGA